MKVRLENKDEHLDFITGFEGDILNYSVALKMDGSCQLMTFEKFQEQYCEDYPLTVELQKDVIQISGVLVEGRLFLCDFDKMGLLAEQGKGIMESNHKFGEILGVSRIIYLNEWYDETRRYRDLFNMDLAQEVIDYYRRLLLKDGYKKVLYRVNM